MKLNGRQWILAKRTPLPPGNKETAFGRFFIAWRKRAGRLRALRVRFEGLGLPAQPAPNPPPAAAARQPRAPSARVRGSNQLFD